MKTPLPEAIDKYSILKLKMERLPKDDRLAVVERELNYYKAVIDAYRHEDGIDVKQEWVDALYDVNGRCWDLEAAIRQGRDDELGLAEIGRRTILLRDMNKERIAAKNRIAEETGMDFFEIKVDHASEI
jgi:hypothetical protein